MMRLQAIRTFLVSAVALSAFGAFAATWTGKGFDDSWRDPNNWDGEVPGAADTAVFDGTSSRNCTINVPQVGSIQIAAGYTGTITLGNAFLVNKSFSQEGGTFTCGDYDLTVGQSGGANRENAAYKGDLMLTGGTFNAPSGTLTWKPYRKNDVVFKNESAAFNANGGTILIDYDVSTYNALGWVMTSTEKTYHNITFCGKKDGSCKLAGTMNVVNGTLRMEGCKLNCSASSDSTDYTKKPVGFVINGKVEYAGTSFGGSVTLLFNSGEDQTIEFSRNADTAEPRGFGMVIDKPTGAKVAVTSSFGKAYFGTGKSTWACDNTIGGKDAISCIYVKSGELDMSSLDEVQVNSDNGAVFGCASEGSVSFPKKISHSMRLSATFSSANGLQFKSLELRSGGNVATFPKSTTNFVSGTLTLDGSSWGCAYSVDFSELTDWKTKCVYCAAVAVSGDVYVRKNFSGGSMGGPGRVLLCGTDDQTIHGESMNAALPTLEIDKPSGKVLCEMASPEMPLLLASNGATASGGSFLLANGEMVFPPAGICFTNLHNQAFFQSGGKMNSASVPLTVAHRDSKNYCYTLVVSTIDPLGSVVSIGQYLKAVGQVPEVRGDIRLITAKATPVFVGKGVDTTWMLGGDGDQTYSCDRASDVFYNTGSSVSGGLKIAKTGGKLKCLTPLKVRNLEIAAGSVLEVDCPATFDGAILQASNKLVLPASGTVGLALGDVPGDVDDLSRDLISYVGTISNYRADGWTFDLGANFSRPKVAHDASAKLISFSCRRRRGLKLLVR